MKELDIDEIQHMLDLVIDLRVAQDSYLLIPPSEVMYNLIDSSHTIIDEMDYRLVEAYNETVKLFNDRHPNEVYIPEQNEDSDEAILLDELREYFKTNKLGEFAEDISNRYFNLASENVVEFFAEMHSKKFPDSTRYSYRYNVRRTHIIVRLLDKDGYTLKLFHERVE